MGRTVEGAGVGGFRPRLPGLLGIATLLAGCGGRTPGPPPAPEPLTAPGVEVSQALPPDPGAGELPPFFRLEDPDPILDSPRAWDPEILDDVQWWIDLFTDRGAGTFASWLEQMGRWEGLVDEEIARRGLPPSLRYLPMIESGYRPAVRSRAGAVGMWQIMGPTARSFGMEVTRLLDERRDPLVSTPLALDYLSELNERFGSWFLALAAYNGGPGRVESLLRRHALGARGDDSLFLVIREHLPGETRRFVPKLLAAARIARSPDRYGFAEVEALSPTAFDVVTVPDATSLDVLAGAAEVSQSVVEEMNPHILRGVTPTGRPVGVRVPAGQGAIFERNYARIPPGERVTFLEHRVAPG
ncbi:MAG TPA: lytic transglycosylase domain-containing protein, partial [Longimicrobiales bacterium]|nr:lytic transglycosylase domain-containing protein [Longimicrobiales bacterium]